MIKLLNIKPRGLVGNGHRQVLLHIRLIGVQRHVQPIKTCVRPRKHFHILVPMESKVTNIAVVTLKESKSLSGHTASTGGKLQQLCFILLGIVLEDFPEPLDHLL
jgi:hypothetical protein